jgi:alpha/beta superfamily hydrolase
MNAHTKRTEIAGPAGPLACAIDDPRGTPQGVAVLCHPHPLHGGTMDNKVVQTLARAFVQMGWRALRFDFRGVGRSGGQWAAGEGEVDDVLAVVAAFLGGFSFGGAMAARAAARLPGDAAPERVVLVAPAVLNFPPPAVTQDTLLLHGEADEVVPLSAVLDWARPAVVPVTVLPGTGHFFHGQLSLLKTLVVRRWPEPAAHPSNPHSR